MPTRARKALRPHAEGILYAKALAHLDHHRRFYLALGLGLISFAATSAFTWPFRLIAASDTFFSVYLVLIAFISGGDSAALRRRAATEDEGIFLVILIVLAAVATSLTAVLIILRNSHGHITGPLLLALAAAPLGWFTLHVTAAFHYANLFYGPCAEGRDPPLIFPGGADPTAWDFLYYAFVIGMTAQVSDVQVAEGRIRRATLGHGVISFLFNTVLIAMAVNAVVTLAA
ncbi:MAG TPA: DUF1345 domain-containing protein [Rhizomicrobium sp.]|nr:DUF1345 domain-containing protein [Rhizomicrobium sp.]